MRLSLLASIALTAATLVPAHSLESEARVPPSIESKATSSDGDGSLGTTSHWEVTNVIYNSSFDFLDKWYDEYVWVNAVKLGQHLSNINADTLFYHATELHPSEKVHEFKESVDSVIDTAMMLCQMVLATAEQHGVPPDSVKEEFGVIYNDLLDELKKQFPSPAEAPGHENRALMVDGVLDFVDKIFLQFAIKLGVSEESLKTYSDPLKLHVQIIVVTIGDLVEQHPEVAMALLFAAMIELGIFESLLTQVLRILGFHPLGPKKGSLAAWVQGWLFRSAIPKGSWFAALQHLAMTL